MLEFIIFFIWNSLKAWTLAIAYKTVKFAGKKSNTRIFVLKEHVHDYQVNFDN